MRQVPVKASGFVKLSPELKALALANGILPVNDIFLPYWNDDSKIFMLYGGYGSGKSVFFVDKLIDECRNNDYFRCFYGRKVYDTVRVSIFLTITDRIEERGLQREFLYSKADNSSMIIRHRETNGSFNPFGADNPEKLKSVKDPSHIFCEELDQFSATDFGVLLSRLRTQKVKTKMMCAFNTTQVKEGHWIKTTFFGEEENHNFTEYSITKVFCNYPDNHFINHKEYEQTLWISAVYNEQKFREISAGEWGADETANPFIFTFNRKEHIVKGLQVLPDLPIILSFDFNVEPMTCLAGQIDGFDLAYVLEEYRLMNSDIEELCLRILADFSDKKLIVTGDASGQSRTALKRDLNYYKEIKRVLRLSMGQFKLPSGNPPIKSTRELCNRLLKKHKNYKFSDRVPYLIMDIEQTQVDAYGDIDEGKDKHKGHLFACWRYFNWTFLHKFIDSRDYAENSNLYGAGNQEYVPKSGYRVLPSIGAGR